MDCTLQYILRVVTYEIGEADLSSPFQMGPATLGGHFEVFTAKCPRCGRRIPARFRLTDEGIKAMSPHRSEADDNMHVEWGLDRP
jgi:hypothetical protein